MHTKRQRFLAIVAGIAILFFVLSSLLFIVKESNHQCADPDCSVCEFIHTAENNLRSIGTASMGGVPSFIIPILYLFTGIVLFTLFIPKDTLISQKVRMDN